uniref:Uncharacterized protein n=1 Tax=Siphoviridae sp. ctKgQ2 TaxID=2827842 RepID=A0A8S5TMN8_9CAUD|nr:MAG TPA: hypothetical protein [Siphoviridae sp. ctKgQ2]
MNCFRRFLKSLAMNRTLQHHFPIFYRLSIIKALTSRIVYL